jgi:predicted acyltransferase (DUF342 family)
MPSLLSGSKLRTGGSGEFLKLADAQPQLPQSPSTSTGYTIITSDKLVSTYASSLGNIEFHNGQVYSNVTTTSLTLIGTGTTAVVITANSPVSSTSTLIVQGGASVFGDLFVSKTFEASTSSFLTLKVTSTATSTTPFTGALQVVGGVGIGENLNVFGKLSVLNTASFAQDVNITKNVYILGQLNATGNAGTVTLSPVGADVNIQPSIGGTILIQPSAAGHIENMTIGYSVPQDGYFQTVHATNSTVTTNSYVGGNVKVQGLITASTATIVGDAVVSGSVYSKEGIADYNNLLYTPRVTISTTAPADARIGDFWINPTYGVECQYVNDGGNFIWIQFTGF